LKLLVALRDQVLNSEIVSIFSIDKEHVNRIFQNINSKGKPLSKVDLIKNHLFSKIDITSAGVDEMSECWKEILKNLGDIDIPIDEFFFHFWKAIFPNERVTSTNLYEKYFAKYGNSDEDELKGFVDLLCESLKTYSNIVNPKSETKQQYKFRKGLLKSLNKFHGVQARIILLAFYSSLKTKKIKLKKKVEKGFLEFLSDFHFIVFGTKLEFRTNKLSVPYNRFIKDMHDAADEKGIISAINNIKGDLLKQLDEKHFILAFKELEFSKKYNREDNYSAQYAIKRIANILDKRDYDSNEFSIEHIIDECEDYDNKNIGNLTVLETRLNTEINTSKQKANKVTFYTKKEIYKNSGYKMAKDVCNYKLFTQSDFNERSENLAKIFWDNLNKYDV
ncbi:TPA: GmrSD restriction endonuclease domain-containing protein, partial [Haemophilus influenzae]